MKIGIPRALATYEYPILYTKFFELLKIDIILSDDTDREILNEGILKSIDESCLASKVFIGHVDALAKRNDLDYIFIPRICTFTKTDTVCVKFYAMYDICKNIFPNSKFVTLNIDYLKGENEFKAFVKLGKKLGKRYSDIVIAYLKAKQMQRAYDYKKLEEQIKRINNSENKNNILIVSHRYISHDKYMGYPVIKYLKDQNINIIYAGINDITTKKSIRKIRRNSKNIGYENISKNIYWKYSKDLLNGVDQYLDKVDGIIYLSVFPCGPDSLVNELAIRKITSKPSLNIIIDEQDSNTGLYTRLESFIDILEQLKLKSSDKLEESVV